MNRHLPLPEQPKPEEKKLEEVKTETKGKHRNIVDENIIDAPKMRNNFWYHIKMVIFQYCDSNFGLFFFAPNLVIALPT